MAKLTHVMTPTQDPKGMKLKQEIADIRTKALAEDPRTVVHVFIREPNVQTEGPPTKTFTNENDV
jgi:hypothetical protein